MSESESSKESDTPTPATADVLIDRQALATLYQALMAHALNQDGLMWSRVQILIAIQGAAIAAGYTLRHELWLAMFLMVVAALLTFFVILLARNDLLDRNTNLRLMDALATVIVPDSIKAQVDLPDARGLVVRIVEPEKKMPVRGRVILFSTLWLFFWIDLLLAWGYLL